MENSHVLFPGAGSSSFSGSQFSLNMGINPQAQAQAQTHAVSNFQLYTADTTSNILSCDNGPSGSNDKVKQGAEKGENKGIKKHRYAFQTRSQVDILDDGYRWRKYGQKIVKNSNFPRSYYKCTHKGCNVKKQVQRSSKDEQNVVTTYEGIHTHPIGKLTDSFEQILFKACTTTS